jgi:hypothetical protein
VQARVRFWKKRLRLTDWAFKIEFGKIDDDETDAACSAQPEYRYCVLHFNLAHIPMAELDDFVCHEMIHALVWPLGNAAHAMAAGDKTKEEWVRTEEEGLVTALQKLFVGMLEK